jgi:hypothetical protein
MLSPMLGKRELFGCRDGRVYVAAGLLSCWERGRPVRTATQALNESN